MLEPESKIVLDIWSARIPGYARFAEHHWFIIARPGSVERWEVWQDPNQCDKSWGRLHRNLLRPSAGEGNGRGRMLERLMDELALMLAKRIETSPQKYPWTETYLAFPGQNRITFVQWVLGDTRSCDWLPFCPDRQKSVNSNPKLNI
ncbi:DUF3750 domain-containing protein [Rubripirellula reticaptiva]|uniref:Uncharacterized protein n=1 Tax=Rubripirellula reticaptiva TaxID=2528013 RepID=A0A5C6F7Q8_9BACT|nr:DUF3750 domain-containing protein [Rubripirellula reticaptiva]TWU57418.1 hypothetical protein Poly59_03250 [Rubripirellula reticaptiva]